MNGLEEREDGARGRIITLTPNPALDLTYTLAKVERGTSHRVDMPLSRAGGKGINVARVAFTQGFDVLAIAPVGGATGDVFRRELEQSGVPAKLVDSPTETRRSIAIVETGCGGESTLLNEAGGSQPAAVLAALLEAAGAAAAGASVMVGSGSMPGGATAGFYSSLARLAADAGLPCILDTSGGALLDAAEAGATLLKPNHHELLEATGAGSVPAGAAALMDRGAKQVLVSRGAEGMSLFDAGNPGAMLTARLPWAIAGNATGAGDAAVAAVASCLAEGVGDPAAVLRRAVAWSAAAVLMPGAGEISPQQEEFATLVVIEKESF